MTLADSKNHFCCWSAALAKGHSKKCKDFQKINSFHNLRALEVERMQMQWNLTDAEILKLHKRERRKMEEV
jgi:hypothetical protein